MSNCINKWAEVDKIKKVVFEKYNAYKHSEDWVFDEESLLEMIHEVLCLNNIEMKYQYSKDLGRMLSLPLVERPSYSYDFSNNEEKEYDRELNNYNIWELSQPVVLHEHENDFRDGYIYEAGVDFHICKRGWGTGSIYGFDLAIPTIKKPIGGVSKERAEELSLKVVKKLIDRHREFFTEELDISKDITSELLQYFNISQRF